MKKTNRDRKKKMTDLRSLTILVQTVPITIPVSIPGRMSQLSQLREEGRTKRHGVLDGLPRPKRQHGSPALTKVQKIVSLEMEANAVDSLSKGDTLLLHLSPLWSPRLKDAKSHVANFLASAKIVCSPALSLSSSASSCAPGEKNRNDLLT